MGDNMLEEKSMSEKSLILVKQNNMTYDSNDPRCQIVVGSTNATNGLGRLEIAFITVVDDSSNMVKRYFGVFDWNCAEHCISCIMDTGGKWPDSLEIKGS